jgi:hypothetical protein
MNRRIELACALSCAIGVVNLTIRALVWAQAISTGTKASVGENLSSIEAPTSLLWERFDGIVPARRCRRCGPSSLTPGCRSSSLRAGADGAGTHIGSENVRSGCDERRAAGYPALRRHAGPAEKGFIE